jgi:hypothetical protein
VARGAQGAPGQGVRQGVQRWPGGKVARGVRTRSVEKTRVKSGFVFPILSGGEKNLRKTLRRKSIFPVQ